MTETGGEADSVPPASGWSAHGIVFDPAAVLRACAWPLSTLDGFDHPEVAALADALLDERDAVGGASEELADRLAEAVPEFERPVRAALLGLRRRCHRDVAPFEELTEDERVALTESGIAASWQELAESRRALAASEADFASVYERAFASDRVELARLATDTVFRRALVLANRGLARRWAERRPDVATWRAREHRAELAVFRYLVRAATRPVPHGLWGGVCALSLGGGAPEHDVVLRRAPAAVTVDPDPAPLAMAIFAWVHAGRGLDRLLALDATVHYHGIGWRFEHGGREMVWSTLRSDDLIDAVVDHLWAGPARLRDLDGERAGLDADPAVLERLVSDLLAAGFLVPAWSPAEAGDGWSVLNRASVVLVEDEVALWSRSLASLRVLCDRLVAELPEMVPTDLASVLDEARAIVVDLWAQAGVPGEPASDVLLVDMGLPFRAELSEQRFAAMQRAVVEQLALASKLPTLEHSRMLGVLAPGPLSESLTRAPDSAERATMLAAVDGPGWSWLIERAPDRTPDSIVLRPDTLTVPVGGRPVGGAAPGPEGSVLVSPEEEGLVLSFARPQADVFTGRATRLSGVVAGAAPAGAPTLDLEVDRSPNPTACRPPLDHATGAVLASRRGLAPLATQTMRWSKDHRPLLVSKGSSSWLRYAASGASPSGRDAALIRLALSHGWEHLSHGVPLLAEEIDRPTGLPSAVLPSGAVVSRRRWALGSDAVRCLADARAVDRFLHVRRVLRVRGLADVLRVRVRFGGRADAPVLVTPVTSPLGVEAMGEHLDRADTVVLEQWSPSRVSDGTGATFAGEIAVRWRDPQYWDGRMPSSTSTPPAVDPVRWQQLDLEVPRPDGPRPVLPLAELGALFEGLLARTDVDQLWFLRKPPGIRLRIATDGPLPPEVTGWADALVAEGRLLSWAPGTYRPEVRRFGGPVGLALAHRLLTADARAALALEQLAPVDAALRRFPLAVGVAERLVASALDGDEDPRAFWALVASMTPQVDPTVEERHEAEVSARRSVAGVDASIVDLLAPVEATVADLTRDLRIAAEDGWLEVGVVSWLAAVTIFGWNQLGLPLEIGRLRAHVDAMVQRRSQRP